MHEYETVYIAQPDLQAGRLEKINEKIQKILKEGQAEILEHKDWGTRKLAYRIGKFSTGRYVYFNYTGTGHFIHELERTLKYEEEVIRFLTVKVGAENEVRKKRVDQPEEARLGFEERSSYGEGGSYGDSELNGQKGDDNG